MPLGLTYGIDQNSLWQAHCELAELDVELIARSNAADARGVIETLFRYGDEFILWNDHPSDNVGTFIEDSAAAYSSTRLFWDVEEAILRDASTVGDLLR
jgi:hypothetical protein